jgi:phosphoribosylanthranilate isomerase
MVDMRTRVKICGITNLADAEVAVEAGADALGFILYPKSPRFIQARDAQLILQRIPPYVERVAVLVNPKLEEMLTLDSQANFSLLQLHGHEAPEFCQSLRPRRLVKALSLPASMSREQISAYPVGAFLLDTPTIHYGGSGQTFNWDLVEDFRRLTDLPLILSGGLHSRNVAEAIEKVRPYAIDVSSGVESSPGKKDHQKLREFLDICKKL